MLIESDQLVMLPTSPNASSTTYSDQVPFAKPPLKVASVTFPLGTGAGSGNGSTGSKLAGW